MVIMVDTENAKKVGINAEIILDIIKINCEERGIYINGSYFARISMQEFEYYILYMSPSTINRTIKFLLSVGLIDITKVGADKCNYYRIKESIL